MEEQVGRLLDDLDFPALYRGYTWRDDTWEKGFLEILDLEREVTAAARSLALGLDHVQKIARRDDLSAPARIAVTLYIGSAPAYWLMLEPGETIRIVERQIRGLGPVCASKLLRFAVPQVFGTLDARLIRVFGRGDSGSQRYPLLDLAVELSGDRWAIPAGQPGWPGEYGAWAGALQAVAGGLNRDEVSCPHPAGFAAAGLRSEGIWAAADVEMALSCYAAGVLRGEERKDSVTGVV